MDHGEATTETSSNTPSTQAPMPEQRRYWMLPMASTTVLRPPKPRVLPTWGVIGMLVVAIHFSSHGKVNAFVQPFHGSTKAAHRPRGGRSPKTIAWIGTELGINDENIHTDAFVTKPSKTAAFSNRNKHTQLVTPTSIDRRSMAVQTISGLGGGGLASVVLAGFPHLSRAVATEQGQGDVVLPKINESDLVDLPLEYVPTLGAYVVRYTLFGEPFRAIVDTGSPFLTTPCYCKPYRNQKMFWGCYKPELTRDSGYGNTIEGFDNNYGTVVWRKAGFSFSQDDTASGREIGDATTDVVFGVLDRDLLNGSGGVFFGLIKETDRWIRPSFLGQTGYSSFCVDLRHTAASTGEIKNTSSNIFKGQNVRGSDDIPPSPRLVLSRRSMIGTGAWRGISSRSVNEATGSEDWIPLVNDLRKKYGAPVVHYTARASSFVVNGLPLLINQRKPLYVIFDTGVSGMVVSQELFDGRYLQARKNKEKSLWGTVEVSFATQSGQEITLSAEKPLTTPLGKATPWKGFKGNLIAIGLAFLDGFATTVDIDDGKILFAEK